MALKVAVPFPALSGVKWSNVGSVRQECEGEGGLVRPDPTVDPRQVRGHHLCHWTLTPSVYLYRGQLIKSGILLSKLSADARCRQVLMGENTVTGRV